MAEQENKSLIVIEKIAKLQNSASTKKQLQIIEEIAKQGETGQEALLELLINRRIIEKITINDLDGFIFEILNSTNIKTIKEKLNTSFEKGLIILDPTVEKNYQPLQQLLICQSFQEADKLTQIILCELAGLNVNQKRNWLYFTDIPLIPSEDLYIIDILWRIYSRGKFGFSIQRQIWLSNNCNWDKLWDKIGWKNGGTPCRYPNDFIWDISAPHGHLPLFNQLRGVQVLSALFQHIVWN